MNISPTDFASLLCSRLCHDLLSPVGALNNGLELLADEHGFQPDRHRVEVHGVCRDCRRRGLAGL